MKKTLILTCLFYLILILSGCNNQSSIASAENESNELSPDSINPALGDSVDQFGWYTDETYLYGLKDHDGTILVEPQFLNVYPFKDGWAAVFSEEFHGFCDTNGNLESLPPGVFFSVYFSEMGGGYYFQATNEDRFITCNSNQTKFGYITGTREIIAPCKYDNAGEFHEGLAFVSEDDKYGYINLNGEIVIDLKYKSARSFSEGIAAVQFENDLIGFINNDGIEIIEPLYKGSEDFINGLCMVYFSDNDGIGFIDKEGNLVIEGPFDEAQSFYSGTALVRMGEKCYYINKKGKKTEDGNCDDFYIGC